ncbi:TraR/DksA C4-type zinc finger protein [Paenibacillus sp. MBLB4367]|uniref:TraR/DksA C4-type zinc finger protein n=1 Tax=Paenibacillus sp. MBLB4367 TaxID=3384767 RepID=UPI003908311E
MSTHLTEDQTKRLRERLEQEKADLERRLQQNEHFGLGESMREQISELSAYDNHPADLGTEMFERGKDIALNERSEFRLEDIDLALQRMDAGTYGLCDVCGKEIPVSRLEALPMTVTCVDHAKERDKSFRRPVEEQFLNPPFGRTSLDEKEGQNGFDGEDAWQIVSSWGTSNSPAMAEERQVDGYDDIGIEEDEADGFVEPIEDFVATDMYGRHVMVVRNESYRRYIADGEGEALLEEDRYEDGIEGDSVR